MINRCVRIFIIRSVSSMHPCPQRGLSCPNLHGQIDWNLTKPDGSFFALTGLKETMLLVTIQHHQHGNFVPFPVIHETSANDSLPAVKQPLISWLSGPLSSFQQTLGYVAEPVLASEVTAEELTRWDQRI